MVVFGMDTKIVNILLFQRRGLIGGLIKLIRQRIETNTFELYILKKESPLLDVNMARLIERFFGESKLADIRHDPYLQTLAYRVVNIEKSKELNWAILDYACIICKKIKLPCFQCVINSKCKHFVVSK